MHIKPGFVAYFSVEAAVPKREGQYIGEIEMETDYEVRGSLVNPLECNFLNFDYTAFLRMLSKK